MRTFPGKCILVAEDYPVNQELMQEMLELMGCQVDIACNGTIAVEKQKSHHYDAIFMDVQMPEKDGYTATREIRQQEKKRTPIIALTASALPEDKEKCLEAGMDDYISKPVDLDQIQRILQKHL